MSSIPEFSAKVEMCGRFKLEVYKQSTGELVKQTDWFNNIVLNQGLNLAFNKNIFSGVAVGTGNSTPVVTQTDLDSRFAATTTAVGSDIKTIIDADVPYASLIKQFRFNAGVFNDQVLTEVGITTNETGALLFNRALILDANGQPSSIQIKSDEYLDVKVELRMYVSKTPTTGSFNLTDKNNHLIRSHSYQCLPSKINTSIFYSLSSGFSSGNGFGLQAYPNSMSTNIFTGYPSGSTIFSTSNTSVSKTYLSYVNDSYSARFRIVVPLSLGNAAAIKSFLLETYMIAFQFQLDETIQKTADEIFTIFFSVSWGRYTGVVE
ncbi:hypothetical protein ADP71_17340 [Vitreoscilla sp. C1]|uniref:hypothetical protein n=1 Tax=Vitreoscilla sp. (strain C1) TaxID=96942 RepID=UPI00148EB8CF|nr:hypothetical protein [Vitreoscilla sp. C1]AUZ05261.2 hypothetical protein ADP71_17340 [Vitreoscilla sp. C1]